MAQTTTDDQQQQDQGQLEEQEQVQEGNVGATPVGRLLVSSSSLLCLLT